MAAEYARARGRRPTWSRPRWRSTTCPRGRTRRVPVERGGRAGRRRGEGSTTCRRFAVDEAPTGSKDPYGPAARRGRAGADRAGPGLGRDPMDAACGPPTRGSASRAPTWRSTARRTSPAGRCRSCRAPRLPPRPARASARRPARPRGASSTARRSLAAGRGRSRRSARHPGVGRGVDGGHPPARASRARARPSDVSRCARRRPGRGGPARRDRGGRRRHRRGPARRATCRPRCGRPGRWPVRSTRFFTDVLVERRRPRGPGAAVRAGPRGGGAAVAASRTSSGSPKGEGRGEHGRRRQAGLRLRGGRRARCATCSAARAPTSPR